MRTFHRQAGLSLIELMVAITIGLFLLIGLVSVFATSNQTYMDLSRASQQIESGRFAMQILVDDIGNAGYFGRYSQTPAVPATVDPCEASDMVKLRDATALPIQGYDAPGATPIAACLPAANYVVGTDIIVVRRADTNMAAGDAAAIAAGALTNGIYIQSNADPIAVPIIGVGTGNPATDGPPTGTFTLLNKDSTIAPIRKYHVHIYFIAPCSVPAGGGSVCTGGADDNGRPIPTLKRIELAASGTMNVVPLVEGIENMQIDYGIDADKDGVPDYSLPNPTGYVTAPATFADWQNVVSIRINLLSRQIEPSGSYVDDKTYDMGRAGTVGPMNDPFKRHVYNAVIRIVNPAARRES